jgi:hypothetical protein
MIEAMGAEFPGFDGVVKELCAQIVRFVQQDSFTSA